MPTGEVLSQEGLEAEAVRLAAHLEPGDTVVLSGEVGAGKTTFVRAACAALGIEGRVTSPTYQLARSYPAEIGGRAVTVNHLDLYRLDGVSIADSLDLDEYLSPESVTFIEWAEPAAGILSDPSFISLEHASETTRRMTVSGPLAVRVRC